MTFEIIQLLQDPETVRSYLEQYKAFRLFSLQTSPEAFASTYAREVAFTDDVWYSRLTKPEATTFLVLESGTIISTLTILGPLSFSPEELSSSVNPWELKGGVDQPQAHYRINAMFTLPEARGKGLAKALIQKSLEFGSCQARQSGKDFVATIVVEKDNIAAKSLYDKCGFRFIKEENSSAHGRTLKVIVMKYGVK